MISTSRCLIQVRRDLFLWPHWINFTKSTHMDHVVFNCFILRCVPFCILLNLKACRVSTNDICHFRHWLSRHNTSIDDHSEPSGYYVLSPGWTLQNATFCNLKFFSHQNILRLATTSGILLAIQSPDAAASPTIFFSILCSVYKVYLYVFYGSQNKQN